MMTRKAYQQAFLFSLGFFGINVIWALFNTFIPVSLGKLGLSATLIGFVVTWDNYLNVFFQPMIGSWSDHTDTAIGRRKPWILVGAPVAAIGFISISWNTTALGIMVFILMTNLGMTLFRSPTLALLGDLFPTEQRSIAGAILDLMGGLGAIIALIAGWLLFARFGLSITFTLGALVMLVAVSVVLWWIKEPTKSDISEEEMDLFKLIKNTHQIIQNGGHSLLYLMLALLCGFLSAEALQAWLSSFGVNSLGLNPGSIAGIAVFFALAFLVFALPAGWLATRFGRKRIILVGFVLTAITIAYGWWVQSELAFIGMLILGGASWSMVSVNALPAMYDFVGESDIGAMTGLYTAVVNIAAALGPQIVGIFIDFTNKNYRITFVVSAIFLLIAALLMTQVGAKSDPVPIENQPRIKFARHHEM